MKKDAESVDDFVSSYSQQNAMAMNLISQIPTLSKENENLKSQNEFLRKQHANDTCTIKTLNNCINSSHNTGEYDMSDYEQSDDVVIGSHEKPRLELACKYLEDKGLDFHKKEHGWRKKIAKAVSAITGFDVRKCQKYIVDRDYSNKTTAKDIIAIQDAFHDIGIDCPL